MLKPAKLYQDRLMNLYTEMMYDISNQYFVGYIGDNDLSLLKNSWEGREYVSVDEKDNIIGFFRYSMNNTSYSVNCIGLVSFRKGDIQLISDVYYHVHELFTIYNINRMEWCAFTDAPVIRHYRKFIKYCNGRSVGIQRQTTRLMDGLLHDMEEFEVLQEDYLKSSMYHKLAQSK